MRKRSTSQQRDAGAKLQRKQQQQQGTGFQSVSKMN